MNVETAQRLADLRRSKGFSQEAVSYTHLDVYKRQMFEMKNENDETATKHKNEDFFKKLDHDRRQKGCEYAVLCTCLLYTSRCV